MNGEERRKLILQTLLNSETAIPARKFAEEYDVSRQIIVGDIALLRAEGNDIIATNKGYIIKSLDTSYIKKEIAMCHSKEDTRKELETFVKHGIIVESVTVEHPVYGEITGQLNIKTPEDIDDFLSLMPELLSTLTEGVHIHTIYFKHKEQYEKLLIDLKTLNFLYSN